MTILSITSLFSIETAATILNRGLGIARGLGLPVSSWRTGDPTKSYYVYLAQVLGVLEGNVATYIKAGFLSAAVADAEESGDSSWLKVLAWETFGVEAVEATYATGPEGITLHNTGGGYYPIAVGDLTFKASGSGKTYHNTTAGVLSAGAMVTFDYVADEAGSDSSVSLNDIDTIVTTRLGVEIVSSIAAVGLDEQSPASIAEQCRATLGALSPNGPADAYEYVARNSKLTGTTEVVRAKSTHDSTTGNVTVYVAGAAAVVTGGALTAVQAALARWAQPLCITATAAHGTPDPRDTVATYSGVDLPANAAALASAAVGAYYASVGFGGLIVVSKIESVVQKVLEDAGASEVSVGVTTPAVDDRLGDNEFPTIGTTTITEAP